MSSSEKVLISKNKLDNLSIAIQKQTNATEAGLNLEQMTEAVKTLDGSSTQSDWNESDTTSAAYIKNRPFYKESIVQEVGDIDLENPIITYNISDEETVYFYKLGDVVISADSIKNQTLLVTSKEGTQTFYFNSESDDNIEFDSTKDVMWSCNDFYIYVYTTDFDKVFGIESSGITIEPGFYYYNLEKALPENPVTKIEFITKYEQIPINYLSENFYTKTEVDKKLNNYSTKKDLEKHDTLDTVSMSFGSQITNLDDFFSDTTASFVPSIDMRKITSAKRMFANTRIQRLGEYFGSETETDDEEAFYSCWGKDWKNLTDDDALDNTFTNCQQLKELYIQGVQTNIDLGDVHFLTPISVYHLINIGLREVTTNKTLTLNSGIKVTAAEVAVLQEKGWTLVGGDTSSN